MNVEVGTEAAQFPEKEYINGIFVRSFQFSIVLNDYYTMDKKLSSRMIRISRILFHRMYANDDV
jgi:hypothetical protein